MKKKGGGVQIKDQKEIEGSKGTRRNNSPQVASLVANPETRAGPGPPKAGQGLVRNLKSPWNAVEPPNHQAGQSRFSQRCRASHTLVGPCWRYTRRLEPSSESLSLLSGAAFPPFVSISERPLHCIPLHHIASHPIAQPVRRCSERAERHSERIRKETDGTREAEAAEEATRDSCCCTAGDHSFYRPPAPFSAPLHLFL